MIPKKEFNKEHRQLKAVKKANKEALLNLNECKTNKDVARKPRRLIKKYMW